MLLTSRVFDQKPPGSSFSTLQFPAVPDRGAQGLGNLVTASDVGLGALLAIQSLCLTSIGRITGHSLPKE